MHRLCTSRWLLLATASLWLALVVAAEQHNAPHDHQSAPTMSMGSESSSALESSAALAGDDLMAAESAQPAELNAEHKAFTQHVNNQVRQVSSQLLSDARAPPTGLLTSIFDVRSRSH